MSIIHPLSLETPEINALISDITAIDTNQESLTNFVENSMDHIIKCISFVF